jgi:hypothetical protein
MNETLQKTDDEAPYNWILKWPYPPPISFFEVVVYDRAGHSDSDEFGYTMPWKMKIIGLIRNLEFMGPYLKFHADFVISFSYSGFIINKDIVIEYNEYEGTIQDRFINAEIWCYFIPMPKKIFPVSKP